MSLRWNQPGIAYRRDGDDARVLWGTGDPDTSWRSMPERSSRSPASAMAAVSI